MSFSLSVPSWVISQSRDYVHDVQLGHRGDGSDGTMEQAFVGVIGQNMVQLALGRPTMRGDSGFDGGVDVAQLLREHYGHLPSFEAQRKKGKLSAQYEKATFTWAETTEGLDQLTPAQINKLGQISVPRGTPPEPAGVRDWMLTSATQSQAGELYRTALEWSLSDEGGHDDFLYD